MDEKVIFLDIDGPMIPYTSFLFNVHASFDQELDTRCIKVLKKIIEESNAYIVFNTTHNRMLYPSQQDKIPGLINQFEQHGLGDRIHKTVCTVYPDTDRLTAIRHWLSSNNPDANWVALDDVKINHDRACLVDADLGIGMREYNHCAQWFGYKPFLAL